MAARNIFVVMRDPEFNEDGKRSQSFSKSIHQNLITKYYTTQTDAEGEARRLVGATGAPFFVMQGVGYFEPQKTPVKYTELPLRDTVNEEEA